MHVKLYKLTLVYVRIFMFTCNIRVTIYDLNNIARLFVFLAKCAHSDQVLT